MAEGKWLTASVTDDIATAVAAGFGEAARRDPSGIRNWIVPVDGEQDPDRGNRGAQGLRPVQIWVPDVNAEGSPPRPTASPARSPPAPRPRTNRRSWNRPRSGRESEARAESGPSPAARPTPASDELR
ncbi:MAG: antitoxin MazE-like protein [Streptosporangiaceae bacterium]